MASKEVDKEEIPGEPGKDCNCEGWSIRMGPGNSQQRNFLPHPIIDFIYAIIIEEYGIDGRSI